MANEEQLSILKQGVDVWNKWRLEHPHTKTILSSANLSHVSLREAIFYDSDLSSVDFSGADLSEANLNKADLSRAIFNGTLFNRTDLSAAQLSETDLTTANFSHASLGNANLHRANLRGVNLVGADLGGADLSEADLANANLSGARLAGANLSLANLSSANLSEAALWDINFRGTNLIGADLRKATLQGALLIGTLVHQAKISGSSVYGISVWDLTGEFGEQRDLVITPNAATSITVDNLKVAQFIYLILNNEELRGVIDTLTSKSVLILGRFAVPERKAILDSLRNKLREYNLLPIVFDFERSTNRDFTETIKTLAGLSYFVIADITNPKSSPLELQATVPDYQIPFVPIIQEGESPFAMMVDLQKKYNWVLDTLSYKSIDDLIKALKPGIIDPAIQKHNELRLIKARKPKIRSAGDFIEDRGLVE